MSSMMSKHGEFNVFNMSVTEVILIVAFIFLLLASIFHTHSNKLKSSSENLEKIIIGIESVFQKTDILAKKLNLEFRDSDSELERIVEVNRVLDRLNKVINKKIAIEAEWEQLVFSKDVMSQMEGIIDSAHQDLKLVAERLGIETERKNGVVDQSLELRRISAALKKNVTLNVVELSQNLKTCSTDYNDLRKRCGTGYRLCNGKGVFLADITLFDNKIAVKFNNQATPSHIDSRSDEYDLAEFGKLADSYWEYSQAQLCRYQVRVSDSTTSKETYKERIADIERRFYKLEMDRGF